MLNTETAFVPTIQAKPTDDLPLLYGTLTLDCSAWGGITDDQLIKLAKKHPTLRFERIGTQQLTITMGNHFDNQTKLSRLLGEIFFWNKTQNQSKGEILDSGGTYRFEDDSVKMPDISYLLKEELKGQPMKSFILVVPKLAVELVSTYDSLKDAQNKMQYYLTQGVQLGWLIIPAQQTTHVYKPQQPTTIIPFDQPLSGEDILVGFEIILAELFEGLE